MADLSSFPPHPTSKTQRGSSPTTSSLIPSPIPPPPPAYPPCDLCRGTYPLPTFTLTTLDPLIPEIRAIIFDFVKGTQCRSHLVDLICTSRQLYGELAPQLYQSAVLDKATAKGFYYGLGGSLGGNGLGAAKNPVNRARGSHIRKEADDMAARWLSKEKSIVLRDTPLPVDQVEPSLRQPLRKLALISHALSLTLSDDVAYICTIQAIQLYNLLAHALLSKMDPRAFMGRFQNDSELADAAQRFHSQRSGARLFRFTGHLHLEEDLVQWLCQHGGMISRPWLEPPDLALSSLAQALGGGRLDIHIPDDWSARYPQFQLPRLIVDCLLNFVGRLEPGRLDFHNVRMDELHCAMFNSRELHFHLAPEHSRGGCSHLESIAAFAAWFLNGCENVEVDQWPELLMFYGCAADQAEVDDMVKGILENEVAIRRWQQLLDQGRFTCVPWNLVDSR